MLERIILILFILFLTTSLYASDQKIGIPSEVNYKGHRYAYDPSWKDLEYFFEGNFDKDLKKEALISFGAFAESDAGFKNTAYFCQIYDFVKNKYELKTTIKIFNLPGKIALYDFNSDGIQEIIALGIGMFGYAAINVYKWIDGSGGYSEIWSNASVCGVDIDLDSRPPEIRIASSNLSAKVLDEQGQEIDWCYAAEPLWEVYQWNGKDFVYREDLSTAKPLLRIR